MRLCLSFALACLIVIPTAAQDEAVLLSGFESLDGASMVGWSSRLPGSELALNTDPRFISEGAGSVHLQGVAPADATGSSYLSVKVQLEQPIDLKDRALAFDAWTSHPESTQALYVRGYDAAAKTVLSWMSWSRPIREGRNSVELVPGLTFPPFSWENTVIDSDRRDGVVSLEFIIGTRQPGAAYDIYLDNVRLVVSEIVAFADTAKLRRRYPDTPLLREGKADAVILCPEGEQWRAVAGELAAGLREKTGAEFPLKTASDVTDEELRDSQLIALGSVANNRRLLYLYSHRLTYVDDFYPGGDGAVVQSIHDPWGNGNNVLLVGAGTLAGCRLGMEKLLAAVPASGVVPPIFEVELTGRAAEMYGSRLTTEPGEDYLQRVREGAERSLETGAHTGLFGTIASMGEHYALSRKDAYARAFVWLVQRAREHHDSAPTTFGGPWGMDSDFMIHKVIPAWDDVEESPAITPEEQLEVSRILFQWVSDTAPGEASGPIGTEHVRHNHQTFPALGLLYAGDYFGKSYGAAEAKRWVQIADLLFELQARAFKPHEDCNGYQWLTLYHTMLYSLAKPDFTFFDNGNARRCADFAVLCMDNLGYQVTYGDTGAFTGWWSEMPFLAGALWNYRDPRYAWALEKKQRVSGRAALGEFTVAMEGRPMDDLLGSIAWPLDPLYYHSFGGPDRVLQEHAVDKVVFRNGFDPDDQYLLLDGLSNGGHKHLDGNSISRWSENGRIWLADADYILSLPKYHNGVLIFRDGQSAPIPDFVELEHFVDLPRFGAGTTTYRDYAGVDWRRHILWLKDGFFLVADEMVAKQDGDYSFRVVWNTVGEARLTQGGLAVTQDGQHASIAVSPDCRLTLDDDTKTGVNWKTYPFIRDPVVRVFRAIRDVTLKAGERTVIFSLLHASGEEEATPALRQTVDNIVFIEGLDEPVVAGVGGVRHRYAVEGRQFTASAEASLVTPELLCLVGASSTEGFGPLDSRAENFDAQIGLQTGQSQIVLPARTTADAAPSMAYETPGYSPDDVAAANRAMGERAPALSRPQAAAIQAPATLETLWRYQEKLDAYLLTNNTRAFEAVDAGLELTATPEPLEGNVFSPTPGMNTLDNLVDGDLLATEGGCMWADEQPVTLNLSFDNEYDIKRIVLKAWFATASSKDKLFQLGALRAAASGDGFAQDAREIIDFRDTDTHGNWGAPGYGPQTYDFSDLNAKAKSLRLELTPRPGTAIYIAELEVWGNREGLEIDYATRRERGVPVHTFDALCMDDLDGDGGDEILAGASNGKVYALGATGQKLWDFETSGAVNAVATVDFAGDGKRSVIAGSMGGAVTALDAQGTKLWTYAIGQYHQAPHVRTVFGAADAEGRQIVIVGADSWRYYALDATGKLLWTYESVRASTVGGAADVDGDGVDEVIAGTEYYSWHLLNRDGTRRFSYSTRGGPTVNAVASAAFSGGPQRDVLFGGADGNVHCLAPNGSLRWLFNTGDEVTALAACDTTGDGKDELLAGSMSFNVYALDGEGQMLWRRDLGREVSAMAPTPDPVAGVLAGTRDGGLYLLSRADGAPLSGGALGDGVLRIATGRAGQRPVAAVSTAAGELRLMGLQ